MRLVKLDAKQFSPVEVCFPSDWFQAPTSSLMPVRADASDLMNVRDRCVKSLAESKALFQFAAPEGA